MLSALPIQERQCILVGRALNSDYGAEYMG